MIDAQNMFQKQPFKLLAMFMQIFINMDKDILNYKINAQNNAKLEDIQLLILDGILIDAAIQKVPKLEHGGNMILAHKLFH